MNSLMTLDRIGRQPRGELHPGQTLCFWDPGVLGLNRRLLAHLGMSLLSLTLAACASSPPPPPALPPIPPVGEVDLVRATVEPGADQLLDVGVIVFDNHTEAEDTQQFGEWVFSEIRANETQYLPYLLRNTLVQANQWGAVRVLPAADPAVDLSIQATVLASDGQQLQLAVTAHDSVGRVWLDKRYADRTQATDYPESARFTPGRQFEPQEFVEPFQDLYDQINNDLVAFRDSLPPQSVNAIKQVSNLVYANDLSPQSFGHMLTEDAQGLLTVASLPAADDPMLARVQDMRLRHHVFIDTVDEYYEALHDDVQATYVTWRKYSFDQIHETVASVQRAYASGDFGSSRGFQSLAQRYDRYRWSKIYETEFRELATGFNQEIAPAILELNEQVHGLSGTMEEQYIQWRRILRQLFALESAPPR